MSISKIPMVIYRINTGISTDKKHKNRVDFLRERKKVLRKYRWKVSILPKPINPCNWKNFIDKKMIVRNLSNEQSEITRFVESYIEQYKLVAAWYRDIHQRNTEFLQKAGILEINK